MSESSFPTVEYWCELQCPDCAIALDDVRALREAYGDRLEVVLRHFPLDKHKHAFAAAQGASSVPAVTARPAGQKSAADDLGDFSDVEEILKRRGI